MYMLQSQAIQTNKDLNSQILLLQIEKVCIAKIACSNKHSLAVKILK